MPDYSDTRDSTNSTNIPSDYRSQYRPRMNNSRSESIINKPPQFSRFSSLSQTIDDDLDSSNDLPVLPNRINLEELRSLSPPISSDDFKPVFPDYDEILSSGIDSKRVRFNRNDKIHEIPSSRERKSSGSSDQSYLSQSNPPFNNVMKSAEERRKRFTELLNSFNAPTSYSANHAETRSELSSEPRREPRLETRSNVPTTTVPNDQESHQDGSDHSRRSLHSRGSSQSEGTSQYRASPHLRESLQSQGSAQPQGILHSQGSAHSRDSSHSRGSSRSEGSAQPQEILHSQGSSHSRGSSPGILQGSMHSQGSSQGMSGSAQGTDHMREFVREFPTSKSSHEYTDFDVHTDNRPDSAVQSMTNTTTGIASGGMSNSGSGIASDDLYHDTESENESDEEPKSKKRRRGHTLGSGSDLSSSNSSSNTNTATPPSSAGTDPTLHTSFPHKPLQLNVIPGFNRALPNLENAPRYMNHIKEIYGEDRLTPLRNETANHVETEMKEVYHYLSHHLHIRFEIERHGLPTTTSMYHIIDTLYKYISPPPLQPPPNTPQYAEVLLLNMGYPRTEFARLFMRMDKSLTSSKPIIIGILSWLARVVDWNKNFQLKSFLKEDDLGCFSEFTLLSGHIRRNDVNLHKKYSELLKKNLKKTQAKIDVISQKQKVYKTSKQKHKQLDEEIKKLDLDVKSLEEEVDKLEKDQTYKDLLLKRSENKSLESEKQDLLIVFNELQSMFKGTDIKTYDQALHLVREQQAKKAEVDALKDEISKTSINSRVVADPKEVSLQVSQLHEFHGRIEEYNFNIPLLELRLPKISSHYPSVLGKPLSLLFQNVNFNKLTDDWAVQSDKYIAASDDVTRKYELIQNKLDIEQQNFNKITDSLRLKNEQIAKLKRDSDLADQELVQLTRKKEARQIILNETENDEKLHQERIRKMQEEIVKFDLKLARVSDENLFTERKSEVDRLRVIFTKLIRSIENETNKIVNNHRFKESLQKILSEIDARRWDTALSEREEDSNNSTIWNI